MFGKNRLEAFSDGVLAIIITIMVLELKAPHQADIASIVDLTPKFLSYVLSFIYVGLYWNNHHHMFHMVQKVTGKILWANTHLLFWLSLIPFSTSWMGETHFSFMATIIYGVVLLMSAIAYFILQHIIIQSQGKQSKLKAVVGKDMKGKISVILYLCGLAFGILNPYMAIAFYASVAVLWFIPDKRIERAAQLSEQET
ncbi:TMEM175 family protein [Neisseria sp. Ec49-e6-T10]|uniref:TMEM175 family protein n=1 Tax=Neisseria sp. Ec49-e6-T10 TaxID=3140744 RepID=UPI003EBFBBD4